MVQQFLSNLAQHQQDYSLTFSLLAYGEIGRGANLSKLQELKPAVLNEEEGTRNVVAECLGKLCLMSPEALLPKLKASLSSPSALMRTNVVTAMKFTISDQPQPIDQLLRTEIGHFLETLKDPDLNVRRVALVALNRLRRGRS